MVFYHRTSEEAWKQIQEDGYLWGIHGDGSWEERNKNKDKCTYRYTYLSPDDVGDSYGNILLQIEYEPKREDFGKKHNYGFDPPPGEYCWQFSVFDPIPLCFVKLI